MAMFLKFQYEVIKFDSRDSREMAVAQEAGYKVSLLTGAASAEAAGQSRRNGIDVYRFWPEYRHTLRPLRIIEIFRLWCGQIRAIRPQIISCHDIFALLIGWMSTWFWPTGRKHKPLLVYDSHEYQIGRQHLYSGGTAFMLRAAEKFLMKRCVFSIMVNDSIADAVQKAHKLKERPLVVRSTTWCWQLDKTAILQKRQELLAQLNADETDFIVMYHGAVMPHRGIEQLLELLALNPALYGIILGNPIEDKNYEGYYEGLKEKAQTLGVQGRVLFLPAVPPNELWQFIGAANTGLVLVQNVATSYYYSLPNKFFENIQSLTPIVASNFPEMSNIIDKYGIGLVCPPDDVSAINKCVEKLRTDNAFYLSVKKNLAKAKEELCWENEKNILLDAYKKTLKMH